MDDWLTPETYGKIKVKGRSQKSSEDSGVSNQDSVTRIQDSGEEFKPQRHHNHELKTTQPGKRAVHMPGNLHSIYNSSFITHNSKVG